MTGNTPRTPGPADGCAWITGASSGIGAATARRLAGQGWTVVISARSADKLQAIADEDHGEGRIIAWPLDVTDPAAVSKAVDDIGRDVAPIAFAFLNAGLYRADTVFIFSAERFGEHFAVNIQGMANALDPLLAVMRARGWGHIALMASVSGYSGLPTALSYASSKAAVINLAEGLRLECAPIGVKIQLVNPGFVKTELTDTNRFPMPFLIQLDDAVTKLVDGLHSKRFEIVFPWRFAFLLKRVRALPYSWFFALVSRATGVAKRNREQMDRRR